MDYKLHLFPDLLTELKPHLQENELRSLVKELTLQGLLAIA